MTPPIFEPLVSYKQGVFLRDWPSASRQQHSALPDWLYNNCMTTTAYFTTIKKQKQKKNAQAALKVSLPTAKLQGHVTMHCYTKM